MRTMTCPPWMPSLQTASPDPAWRPCNSRIIGQAKVLQRRAHGRSRAGSVVSRWKPSQSRWCAPAAAAQAGRVCLGVRSLSRRSPDSGATYSPGSSSSLEVAPEGSRS